MSSGLSVVVFSGIAVELAVFIIEEGVAAIISALRYVVRGSIGSGKAWHGEMISAG